MIVTHFTSFTDHSGDESLAVPHLAEEQSNIYHLTSDMNFIKRVRILPRALGMLRRMVFCQYRGLSHGLHPKMLR